MRQLGATGATSTRSYWCCGGGIGGDASPVCVLGLLGVDDKRGAAWGNRDNITRSQSHQCCSGGSGSGAGPTFVH